MRERFRDTMDRLAVAVNKRRSAAPAEAVLSGTCVSGKSSQGGGGRRGLATRQKFCLKNETAGTASLPRIGRATRFTPPML